MNNIECVKREGRTVYFVKNVESSNKSQAQKEEFAQRLVLMIYEKMKKNNM